MEVDHSDKATCEACPNKGTMELYPDINGMLLCPDCISKEELIRNSPESQQARVNELKASYPPGMNILNERLRESHEILNSIKIRSDVFNAETVAIMDIKKTIDADDSIPIDQKYFTWVKETTLLNYSLKKAIFENSEEGVRLVNRQQAIQTNLNELANKLRIDEREKLKLINIDYKPTSVKVSKPKENKVGTKKFDRAELKKWASLSGAPEAVLQGICVAKNMSPELAASHYQSIIQATKQTNQ